MLTVKDCLMFYLLKAIQSLKDYKNISNSPIFLTYCRLVMPYGDAELGQHWLM